MHISPNAFVPPFASPLAYCHKPSITCHIIRNGAAINLIADLASTITSSMTDLIGSTNTSTAKLTAL